MGIAGVDTNTLGLSAVWCNGSQYIPDRPGGQVGMCANLYKGGGVVDKNSYSTCRKRVGLL